MKKTISLILCFLMLFSIVPLSASAENPDIVEVDNVNLEQDAIYEAGEKISNKFSVGNSNLKLEKVTWKHTDEGVDWNPVTDPDVKFYDSTSLNFLPNRGYHLALVFRTISDEYDVEKFTLKTKDNTYTSYESYCYTYLARENNGPPYNKHVTVAYFYFPISELGKKVSSYAELQEALFKPGDAAITLKNDITKEIGLGKTAESDAAQLIVNGRKWLNLNGKKLKVVDHSDVTANKDESLLSYRTLFTVTTGSEFVVDDTKGNGEVKYDAHFISVANDPDYSLYNSMPTRNMFMVDGKLTVNGGKFTAGGAKKQLILFTYIRQLALGYIVKTGENGEAVFNDGTFIGHTIAKEVSGFTEAYRNFYKDHISARHQDNYILCGEGKITINNGEFKNVGSGHFVGAEKLNIVNGSFYAEAPEKIRLIVGTYSQGGYKTMAADGKIGSFNIPANSWDSKSAIILKDGQICFNPAADYLDGYRDKDRIDIFTALRFERATPAFYGKDTSTHITYAIGSEYFSLTGDTHKYYGVSYNAQALPQFLIDKGFELNLRGTLRGPSGEIIYQEPEEDDYVSFKPLKYCTTPGTYTYYVTFVLTDKDGKLCGVRPYTVIISAVKLCAEHDFNVIKTTATCTEGGSVTETCTKCNETKISSVDALGHTYEEYSAENQWSYDDDNHWKYCYRCNQTVNKGIHGYRAGESVCVTCGLDNNCDYGNAMDMEVNETHHWWPCDTHGLDYACPNDHKLEYGAHTVQHGAMGDYLSNTDYNCHKGYVCSGCGYYFGETENHDWVPYAEKAATCYSEGQISYKCTNNGKIDPHNNKSLCGTMYVTIPKIEHKWELVSDTATCQSAGKATYKCTATGCTETKVVDSPATGHIYGLVSDTATCTAGGTATYKCNLCGVGDTKATPAKGHNYQETGYKDSTCGEDGYTEYKCTVCKDTKKDTINATGAHNYQKIGYTAPTCTVNGSETYKCDVCEVTKTESVSATDHSYDGSVCVKCGDNRADRCSCKCHGNFIQKLIFKITNFFAALFNPAKKICQCGAGH